MFLIGVSGIHDNQNISLMEKGLEGNAEESLDGSTSTWRKKATITCYVRAKGTNWKDEAIISSKLNIN